MTVGRLGLGGIGVVVAAYGAWLLVSRQSLEQLVSVAIWFGAGVALHDGVLVPVVVVLGWLVARRLPSAVARAGVLVLLLLGPVTLVAVPVLFGERADPRNATLDSRDYVLGWAVLALVVLVVAGAFAVRTSQPEDRSEADREGEDDGGPDPGR